MPLPRIRLSTTWPFGLFRAWSWLHPRHDILVYPAPEAGGPPADGAEESQPAPPRSPRWRRTGRPARVPPRRPDQAHRLETVRAPPRPAGSRTRPPRRAQARACWTGRDCRDWAARHASRAWRAGWSRPMPRACAGRCACPKTSAGPGQRQRALPPLHVGPGATAMKRRWQTASMRDRMPRGTGSPSRAPRLRPAEPDHGGVVRLVQRRAPAGVAERRSGHAAGRALGATSLSRRTRSPGGCACR